MTVVESMIRCPCVVIHRRADGSRDAHGNLTITETTEDTVCAVQQANRDEDSGEIADTRWALFFIRTLRVDNGDAVYVPGLGEFELVGQPWYVVDEVTRHISHIEATARRTDGPEGAS